MSHNLNSFPFDSGKLRLQWQVLTHQSASIGQALMKKALKIIGLVLASHTAFVYVNFVADDYTWAAADDTYFYFAWCDRSDSFGTGAQSRPDANVRFAKIRQ